MSTLIMLAAFEASAEDSDPSTRIARLAYIEGSVSFQPGGTDQWVAPPLNRPLTTGDQLWSDQNSRAELELDGSAVRLAANTAVSLLNISDNVTQIQLSSGSLLLSVRRLDDGETYEVDTPNLAFSVLQPGLYRISVDATGNSTALLVRHGQGEVTGGGIVYPVGEREYAVFSGNDELSENRLNYTTDQDGFERWSETRDARWEHSESAQYVSADVVGYEDLDEQGTWTNEPEYGHVWIPRAVEPGWAPYHSGHWAYVAPWGYTWVDDHAWGFAPFHYGRWVSLRGSWCWIPVPPRRRGFAYVRPVYAPALVAWVGVGAGVAWFALGPREVYVPSYRVSRGYVRNINVSNTNVNTTVINNVYNTTINKRVVNNVTYINRNVPGAVAATTSQAFRSAQPVGRHRVHVDEGAVANARVAPLAPAAMPSKRDLLGSGRTTDIRPPAAVQARPAVARVVPPASAPGFARRPAIINGNERRPFSDNQGRQRNAPMPAANAPAPSTQAAVPAARPAVNAAAPAINAPQPGARVAPSPRLGAPMRNPASASPAANPPAVVSAPNAMRPQEAPRQPPSPAVGNPATERRHVQDQQQQQAQQQQQRQQQAQQAQLEAQRQQQLQAQQQAQQQRQQQAQQAQLEAQRQQQVQAQQQAQQQRQQQAQLEAQRQQQQQAQQQAQQQRQQQAQQAQLEAQRQQQLQAQQQAQLQAQRQQQLQAQQAQQQAQLQAQRQQQLQAQQQAQQQAQEQAQARQQEQRRQQEAAAQKARRPDSTPPKPEK